MNKNAKLSALTLSLLSSAVALAVVGSPAVAQNRPAGTGLDALDEGHVRETLAGLGLEDLLDRSFEVGKIPEDQRAGMRALISLNRLVNQDLNKLNVKQRKEIVAKVTSGLGQALANMKDPRALMNLGGKLYGIGVANYVTLLEYWGEDTSTQAQARAAADAVVKVYEKAEAEASSQMNVLANTISNANDPRLNQLTALQNMVTTIQYTKESSKYAVALTLDKADEQRTKLVNSVIDFLKQYDDPSSSIQPTVKNQIGKLDLCKGDTAAAQAMFQSLFDSKGEVQPAPSLFDQNDARFFYAVADLLAKKPDDAEKHLADAIEWQKANLTAKGDAQIAADADEVLKARIAWLRAELSTSPADKTKYNDQASSILTALMKSNPGLKSLILGQLVSRLPADADLKKLDVLLLHALIEKARDEYVKDAKEPFDKPAIEKGIAAAREIIARKGQPGADSEAVNNAAMVIPYFARKIDQPKVAAKAFLDYAQMPGVDPAKSDDAWGQAMNIIVGEFHAPKNEDADVTELYDRALPLGVNPPLNHKELAYTLARRIQGLLSGDPAKLVENNDQVIKYLKLVPADSPESLNAKYWLSIALSTKLDKDTKLTPEGKTAVLQDIQKICGQISAGAKTELAKNPPEGRKRVLVQMEVRTPLLAASLAQSQQKDPKLALSLLDGYEKAVEGLPNADLLIADAQQTRVFAYMDSGDSVKATDVLVAYLKKYPIEGIEMAKRLFKRLDAEFSDAVKQNDVAKQKDLAPRRALLTGFLSQWALASTDPKVKEIAYEYQSLDAESKVIAAKLESDPAKRKALLEGALKVFDDLIAQPKGAANPTVAFNWALTNYELGNYEKARDAFLKLLRNRQLGAPRMFDRASGEMQDNAMYWEGRYKFLRANIEIAKSKSDAAMMKQITDELRLIYTQYGKNTGGAKWRDEFEKLRTELDPTIPPDESTEPDATQPATTEPAIP
ncbi:hypothetical protein BH10PLA1_BH10PLA1_16660 [soil metagenome]